MIVYHDSPTEFYHPSFRPTPQPPRPNWPTALLPKEEMQALGPDSQKERVLYRQRNLTNANSGERFDVVVLYRPPSLDGWMAGGVSEMRLIFREENQTDWMSESKLIGRMILWVIELGHF